MQQSKNSLLIGAAVVAAMIAGAAVYFWPQANTEAPVAKQTPVPKTETTPDYPVPAPKPDSPPLPQLEASDSLFDDLVGSLFGADAVQNYLVKNDVARHFVVTVDNLPRKKIAERLKPLQPIPGQFIVTGPEGAQTIAPDNSARYTPAVRLFETVDAKALANAYFKVYPLLQQAYVDLGYPNGQFNNRFVEVIDHLLATPDVQGSIKVTQPNVLYEFADPKLEALSSGQKTLLRIGPANEAAVKKKLRELRAILTAKGTG
jgi:hypothetical protein